MSDFFRYVLSELKTSLGLVMIAFVAAVAVLAIGYGIFKAKHQGKKKYPWGKAVLCILFAGYLGVLLYATVLRGYASYQGDKNLHLFRAWREAWNQFTVKTWGNLLLNIALFVPLGAFLPLIWKTMRKWYVAVSIGVAASLALESIQLFTGKGLFDVDDLLANSLGAAIGFCVAATILALFREKGKRLKPALGYGICGFVLLLLVAGPFPVYALQEYGNLQSAPAFTNRTDRVNWVLDCQLPQTPEQAATYQSQKRTVKDCDRFAESYAEMVGADFDDIFYYEEAAYYFDHGGDKKHHWLDVEYKGSGYHYSWGYTDRQTEPPTWIAGTREELEAALEPYCVTIPEYAEFTAQRDGYHEFSVRQHADGSKMIDGTILCRYADDHTIREINHHLDEYTYYALVDILSPKQAYEQLKRGDFRCDYFEIVDPSQVQVRSCQLEYEVDSKGFYQPVYVFDLQLEGMEDPSIVKIPAMT